MRTNLWYEIAQMNMRISAPMTLCGPGFVEQDWEHFRACPFFSGGPGIIVRSDDVPYGAYFDVKSPVEEFLDRFGDAWEVKVEPYFAEDEVEKVLVRIDEPCESCTVIGGPDGLPCDGEVGELAAELANKVVNTSAGEEYELGFVVADGRWSFLYVVDLGGFR